MRARCLGSAAALTTTATDSGDSDAAAALARVTPAAEYARHLGPGPAALGLFPHALADVARLPVREVVRAAFQDRPDAGAGDGG